MLRLFLVGASSQVSGSAIKTTDIHICFGKTDLYSVRLY